MPKRASVPEGKALFYHSADQSAPTEEGGDQPTPHEDSALKVTTQPDQALARDETRAKIAPPPPVQPQSRQSDTRPVTEPGSQPAPAQRHSTRQSAIFLEEYHLDWLDDRCREARRNGGRAVRKAAVIRALLDIAMEANIDLTTLQSEDDIKPRIRSAFRPL
jgi:hypothetical protein